MQIRPAKKADHPRLLELWEASVRASHVFLAEEDLQQLKPLILEQYFDAVDLSCAVSPAGDILGFCGVLQGNIEMLFIDPAMRGKGKPYPLLQLALPQAGMQLQ